MLQMLTADLSRGKTFCFNACSLQLNLKDPVKYLRMSENDKRLLFSVY